MPKPYIKLVYFLKHTKCFRFAKVIISYEKFNPGCARAIAKPSA